MIRWEAHACLPLHPDASFEPIRQYRELGVNYVSINIGMDMNPLDQILRTIAGFRARIAASPLAFRLVERAADIERCAAEGLLAVGFDLEGAVPLLDQPDMVEVFRQLGVRQMHLAYNRNNNVAGGCHDEPQGLTPLGHRVVEAINRAGVLMDCSHTGRRCSLDIMAASSAPVIFSHANPLALVEHGRNITDEQIRACAATGGVVCLSGVSKFLGHPAPGAEQVARHARYVADLVGVAHVGIGLDISFREPHLQDDPPPPYDPTYWWPRSAGYDRTSQPSTYTPMQTWIDLPPALRAVGMGDADIAQVLGGNMMRVARQVWG